jgi:hypothetical protein
MGIIYCRTSAITDGYPWRDSCQWSEAEPARGVTRVAIRWIALFGLFSFLSDNAFAGKTLGENLRFLIFWKTAIFPEDISCRVESATKGALETEILLRSKEIYLREVGLVGKGLVGSKVPSPLDKLPWSLIWEKSNGTGR